MNTPYPIGGRAARVLPLAGVCAAVATAAGYTTIGPNPDGDAFASTDVRYYAGHHTRILVAGILLTYAAVLSALFGVAVWDRIRRSRLHPAVAATALVAATVACMSDIANAGAWYALGSVGGKHTIQPATLQMLHLVAAGSNLAAGAGFGVLLLVAGWAGVSAYILPRWLGWCGLLLGVVALVQTPVEVGFIASLVALLWMCAAGIAMFLRPELPERGLDRRAGAISEPALSRS